MIPQMTVVADLTRAEDELSLKPGHAVTHPQPQHNAVTRGPGQTGPPKAQGDLQPGETPRHMHPPPPKKKGPGRAVAVTWGCALTRQSRTEHGTAAAGGPAPSGWCGLGVGLWGGGGMVWAPECPASDG